MRNTAAGIQSEIAKGAFRPHTALTNMALAYYQNAANYFAKALFPTCPVSLSSDNYYEFSKEDLLRDNWSRKPAYGKVDPTVVGESMKPYVCQVDQMIMGIDQIRQTDLSRRQGPTTMQPKQQRVKTIAEQANIHQDRLFAESYFKAGAWKNELSGVDTTSPSTNEFIKFSNANSDPIAFIDSEKTSMNQQTGRMPNRLGLGINVFNALKVLPALMCVQRKAKKKIVTEADAIQANIDSFGDDIGKTTNWITSMFDVQAQFQKGSKEYEELDYRIKCGQLFQQNAIDKAKGIIAKPMPREWHDRHSANTIEDPERRRFYQRLVADKKPYFMRIIYPALMKQYNTYIKNTNKNAMREFQMTIDEMLEMPRSELSERQKDFLRYYESRMPVGNHDCVMNRICKRFEKEFDGYLGRHNADVDFDYTVMKSGIEYSRTQYNAILKLYENYNKRLRSYAVFANYERVDEYDTFSRMIEMRSEFEQECARVCSNRFVLCDIVLDICYKKSSTKRFAWEMCGGEIIQNLLDKHNGVISYPTVDPAGDIFFCGDRFSLQQKMIGGTL